MGDFFWSAFRYFSGPMTKSLSKQTVKCYSHAEQTKNCGRSRLFFVLKHTKHMTCVLPKKSSLQQCQNYRTISLISHPSKGSCWTDWNHKRRRSSLKTLLFLVCALSPVNHRGLHQGYIVEEQAGFRAGKSTTEKIFNLRIICEKYLQHQQSLYHVFIDFNQAFDRVWRAALWATMKKYISANLIGVIKNPMSRPLVSYSSTAAKEAGCEQQLKSDRDIYSHPPSSTYIWKGSWQTP